MEVNRLTFQIWANDVYEDVVNRDKIEQNVCIVPALFCALHFVNPDIQLFGDKARELEHVRPVRQK